MASWVAVAHAPAVFNLQHLFVCFVNEYAHWKHLLVLLYPHYRGPFILLDCGWSDARSSRPKPRHYLATSPLPPGPFTSHSVSRYYLAPISTTGLSSKPHWHHSMHRMRPRISLYQHFKIQKLKLSMNHLNGEEVVMLLNIDFFLFAHLLLSLITVPPAAQYLFVCTFVCVLYLLLGSSIH